MLEGNYHRAEIPVPFCEIEQQQQPELIYYCEDEWKPTHYIGAINTGYRKFANHFSEVLLVYASLVTGNYANYIQIREPQCY